MGYSNFIEIEQDELTNRDDMEKEEEQSGQILDEDTSIEETQLLVDELEETLRS